MLLSGCVWHTNTSTPLPQKKQKWKKTPNIWGGAEKEKSPLCTATGSFPSGIRDYELANTNAAAKFHCLSSSRSIGTKNMHSRLEKKAGTWENELYHSEDFKHQSWKTTGINWKTSKGSCLGHVFYLNSMQGTHFRIFIKSSMIAALGKQSHWTLALYVY